MSYPIVPDAPLPISMLPQVETLTKNDLLLVTQPGNEQGRRSRSMSLDQLFSSDVSRFQSPLIVKSNILTYSGALAGTQSGNTYTEVAHLDIDPRLDVDFHVWGTSNQAASSSMTRFGYGLRARVRQMYLPDDQDRDLIATAYAGDFFKNEDTQFGPGVPTYNAMFGCVPYNYDPPLNVLAMYPTKRVTLFLSSGVSPNPQQATGPTSYSLSIQATIYPSRYDSSILKATT